MTRGSTQEHEKGDARKTPFIQPVKWWEKMSCAGEAVGTEKGNQLVVVVMGVIVMVVFGVFILNHVFASFDGNV